MNEDQLLRAFEEYKGYELGDFDIATCIQFECYKAGFELRDSFPTEYGTKIDLVQLPKEQTKLDQILKKIRLSKVIDMNYILWETPIDDKTIGKLKELNYIVDKEQINYSFYKISW